MDARKTGYYIKEKCSENNLTQEKLAEMVGVSTVTVSKWINGKQKISPDNLSKLSEALNVSERSIMKGEDLKDENPEVQAEIRRVLKELSDQVDDVQNVTIIVEDRGILATDTAVSALGLAVIALALGVWAAFAHTVINLILCSILGLLGLSVLIFGRTVIKRMEKQLKERKEKLK